MTKGKTNGNGHIEWLKEQAARFQKELAAAEATCLRLKPLVGHFQEAIAALVDPERTAEAADPRHNEHNAAAKLKRQPPYQNIPMTEALGQILAAGGDPIHQDDLVRQVFEIGDENEFHRAKSSLTSTLSHGAKTGRFRSLGNGRYAIENGGMVG